MALGVVLACLAACSADSGQGQQVCSDRDLNVGFYAFFAPVSYSADTDPSSDSFDTHLGYEADLLTAAAAMEGGKLSLSRRGIAEWEDIWLRSAGPEYDLVGGGITILDSRTMDSSGNKAVNFTSGHITFRQSLLTRAGDAERLSSHADLTSDVRVGVLAGTTGESRLLELTGLVDKDGVLAPGVQVETPQGTVVADGSSGYFITAAGESEDLAERRRLDPPSNDMPQVVYLGSGAEEAGESELLEALADGRIDALARGEIGNRDAAARASGGRFVVAALDDAAEHGGFTLDAADAALLSCLNRRIDWLTDDRGIGYAQWLEDPSVFMRRAQEWNENYD